MAATHSFHLSEMQKLNQEYVLSCLRCASLSRYNAGNVGTDTDALVEQIEQASCH